MSLRRRLAAALRAAPEQSALVDVAVDAVHGDVEPAAEEPAGLGDGELALLTALDRHGR